MSISRSLVLALGAAAFAAAPARAQVSCAEPGTAHNNFAQLAGSPQGDWTRKTEVVGLQSAFRDSLSSWASESFDDSGLEGSNRGGSRSTVANLGAFGTADVTYSWDSSQLSLGVYEPGAGGPAPGTTGSDFPLVIEFSSPQQAVSFVTVGDDRFSGGVATVTCAHGGTEVVPFELTGDTEDGSSGFRNIGFFRSVRDASDEGDWCVSVTITPSSGSDDIIIDELSVGSCDGSGDVTTYPCDCPAVSVETSTTSVTLAFDAESPTASCPR